MTVSSSLTSPKVNESKSLCQQNILANTSRYRIFFLQKILLLNDVISLIFIIFEDSCTTDKIFFTIKGISSLSKIESSHLLGTVTNIESSYLLGTTYYQIMLYRFCLCTPSDCFVSYVNFSNHLHPHKLAVTYSNSL